MLLAMLLDMQMMAVQYRMRKNLKRKRCKLVQLITPNRNVSLADQQSQSKLEKLFINYIDSVIANDIAIGRDKRNFFTGEYDSVMVEVDRIRREGGRVFAGGGNVFLLKTKAELQGNMISALHIRGMAQRIVCIKEDLY
jgi:hypothetical protein